MSDAHQVRIAQARGEADAAKARLLATLDEVKVRFAPKSLAGQAVQAAKDKTIVVADETVTAVREKPLVAAGIAGATALLIARKPLFAALGRWLGHDDDTDTDDDSTSHPTTRRRPRAAATEK